MTFGFRCCFNISENDVFQFVVLFVMFVLGSSNKYHFFCCFQRMGVAACFEARINLATETRHQPEAIQVSGVDYRTIQDYEKNTPAPGQFQSKDLFHKKMNKIIRKATKLPASMPLLKAIGPF